MKASNGKPLKPIFTVMTRKSHKVMILGYTSDGNELVYQQDGSLTASKKLISKIPKLSNVKTFFCGEISYDQKYVYIGGESTGSQPLIACVKMSKSFKCVTSQEIVHEGVSGQVNSIKRIPGTDVVLCGNKNGIFVATFKGKSEFVVLFKYEFGMSVGRIGFWGYNLIGLEAVNHATGASGSKMKMVVYGADIDQENFIVKENKWRGGCKNAEKLPVVEEDVNEAGA